MLAVDGQLKLGRARRGRRSRRGLSFRFRLQAIRQTGAAFTCRVFRNSLPEVFEAFDFADPSVRHRPAETSARVAPQALFMMNHPWVIEQAHAAAGATIGGGSSGRTIAPRDWRERIG